MLYMCNCVCSGLDHLKIERRVMVYPVSVLDMANPTVMEVISKDTCEEMKMQFLRPANKPDEWMG